MSIRVAKLRWPAKTSFGRSVRLSLSLLAVGCGAPGEPTAPSPPVAVQISDLTAHQAGDGVQLIFTMPSRTITGDRLISTPAVEILRGTVKPDGSPDLKSLRVVYTIPGSLADKYFVGDKLQFTDPIAAEETKAHPGNVNTYAVRTCLSQKRASANSNIISVRVFSVPQRIVSMDVHVTEPAIELSWAAVERTSAGEPLTEAPRYNIFRAELDDSSAEIAMRDVSQVKWNSKLQLLASQSEHAYSDKSFEFGKTYAYIVRSVVTVGGTQLESDDSTSAVVRARDIFPPAAPQALAAAVLTGGTEGSFVVDLSWSINLESDVAGYRLYRSEQQGTRGQLLPSELLPTPAYRDTSVQPAHHYWYSVTAVDRAGNEGAPSSPVAVEIAQPSP